MSIRPTLRVAFAGTPPFAARALEAILAAGYPVPLVLTQPDRPAGRGMNLQASAVKQVALAAGIPVDQPERLRTPEQQAALAQCGADVLVVAAYGLILPQFVLDLPPLGCINIHASLLPRWRGAAPIQRAIEAGDAQTGITIMQMDAGLDTGPMLLRHSLEIRPQDTAASLHDRLAALGADAIVQALAGLADGTLTAQPQPVEGACYAPKLNKAEATLDFSLPATVLARRIRAFNPVPGALARLGDVSLKLWHAEALPGQATSGEIVGADATGIVVGCGEGLLRITELQKAGARRVGVADFLRGNSLHLGDRLN